MAEIIAVEAEPKKGAASYHYGGPRVAVDSGEPPSGSSMNMNVMLSAVVAALLFTGCGNQPSRALSEDAESLVQIITPADSLAMVHPGGAEIWFREGRYAASPDGQATCYERTLEIRQGEVRHRVPLLYTLAAPVVIDDTSVKAVVYRNCQPRDPYQVSLNTGRPTQMVP